MTLIPKLKKVVFQMKAKIVLLIYLKMASYTVAMKYQKYWGFMTSMALCGHCEKKDIK